MLSSNLDKCLVHNRMVRAGRIQELLVKVLLLSLQQFFQNFFEDFEFFCKLNTKLAFNFLFHQIFSYSIDNHSRNSQELRKSSKISRQTAATKCKKRNFRSFCELLKQKRNFIDFETNVCLLKCSSSLIVW